LLLWCLTVSVFFLVCSRVKYEILMMMRDRLMDALTRFSSLRGRLGLMLSSTGRRARLRSWRESAGRIYGRETENISVSLYLRVTHCHLVN
jgi:hypothetical protein